DDIRNKEIYINAVRLAHKYGQKNMSNYILYNYKDTPKDFYERLKINIELNEEFRNNGSSLKTEIYSFPMRYMPLNAKVRNVDTGNTHWNKKYLRGVHSILNVTRGSVMPRAEFFYQAFGESPEEFESIIMMPEEFIMNRVRSNWRKISDNKKRLMPYVRKWINNYSNLSKTEKLNLKTILMTNDMEKINHAYRNSPGRRLKKLLKYHIEAKDIVKKVKK
ncbi:MAG: hypothetical protein KAW56_04610, partial [Candidatus Marinimicrobia bacterium]|nr:hypothetical protein [Candidatus Neomarinimicrobiota bacterium]